MNELKEKIYLGNYTQDELGVWWKMYPDGKVRVIEEISDLLNFHKAELTSLVDKPQVSLNETNNTLEGKSITEGHKGSEVTQTPDLEMTEHKSIEGLVFKFSPKDYFLVYDENGIPSKYSLCGKIDRSYKGKDEDVGCPVVYLDDDEVEKARKMGFTEVAYSTEPHLNSRNLLERFAKWLDSQGIVVGDKTFAQRWLDEFIESEKIDGDK